MELTEEQLSQMTPEQIRQLQKQQCIFCFIVSKRVQSKIVYEDDKCIAVLDINPANPGHTLLFPKEHYSVSPQIPDDIFAHLGMIAKGISRSMLSALGAQGTSIVIPNGVAAGQRASHFMMHIIPRKEGDNIGIIPNQGGINEKQLNEITAQLKPFVLKNFGQEDRSVKKETPKEEKQAKEEPKQEPKKEEKKHEAPVVKKEDANLDDITSLLLGGKK